MDSGWRLSIVLGVALREGILPAVGARSRTPESVAGELGLDIRATFTVMSALREAGILEETGGGFLLGAAHRGPLLDPDDPEYAGGRVVHNYEVISKWATLPEILRTGRPAEDRTVPDFDGTRTMARAMRAGSKESASYISQAVVSRLPENPRILDVGGGSGANAESFATHGARVTILDRPEVFAVNGAYFEASGVEMIPGDMNEALPEGPFDCVYLGNTSHMYSPDENRALLAKMYAATAPGGYVVLREFVRDLDMGNVPTEAAMFAVNMLVLTARGATYTVEEYAGWLREAGFSGVEFAPIEGRTTALVFARRG